MAAQAQQQGKMGLSKWAFLEARLSTAEELEGQPEYEAWKAQSGHTDPSLFYEEMAAQHARAKYAQGVAYSVYRPGDEISPLIHVGDFADEKSALKALVTESGEAFIWNQEGKTLATRYESAYDAENQAESSGTIRVFERGIAPYRRPVMDQGKLEAALRDAEGEVTQAGSLITAKRFLETKTGDSQYKLFRPDETKSTRTGPIVWSDTNLAIQDVGGNTYIAHDAERLRQAVLAAGLSSQQVREEVKISYSNGQVTTESPYASHHKASGSSEKSAAKSDDRAPFHDPLTGNDLAWLDAELGGGEPDVENDHDDEHDR